MTTSLWRNRDYMILLGGQAVSNAGTFASQVAFPLLVLSLTHSSVQAGLAGALERVPFLILTLPAGALVDRWNRKLVMILSDTGRMLVFAAIPLADLTGHLSITVLYGAALVEGIGYAFFSLCEASTLPRVVPKEQLPTATARNHASYGIALVVGPPIAGTLFGLRRTLPFTVDAFSYAVSVISLLFIRTRFEGDRSAARRPIREEIRDGVVWLWRRPLIRFMAFLNGGIMLLDSGWTLVLIVLGRQELHASSAAIGIVIGIGAVGEIVGAVFAGWIQRRLTFGRAIILSCWGFALGWLLVALAPNLVILTVLVAVNALPIRTYAVVQFSYRVAVIPDELQGRVSSIFRLIASGAMPIGLAVTGAMLQSIGPRATILLVGAGLCLLSLAATLNAHVRYAVPVHEPAG